MKLLGSSCWSFVHRGFSCSLEFSKVVYCLAGVCVEKKWVSLPLA